MQKLNMSTTNIILSVVAVILVVAFGVIWIMDSKEQQVRYAENMEANSQVQVERRERMVEMEQRELTDSFYQKLADGFDVKILIVGDSISLGKGISDESFSWVNLLESDLVETYNVNVQVQNVSLSYSTAYAGYVRTMALPENDYDLAIICYGQNDDEKTFANYYEGLIRAIRSKNERCSIISVLESSQRKYTNKIKTIQELSEHYGNQVADLIDPFNDTASGDYKNLTSNDGINPNESGQKIYADVISKLIADEVEKDTPYNDAEVEIVNDWAKNLNKFKGITASEFKRTDNKFVYTLNEPLTGFYGIDYKYVAGENGCKIFIDGKEYKAPEAIVHSDAFQLYIIPLGNQSISAKQSIELRFSTDEQANAFKGVCVSWE